MCPNGNIVKLNIGGNVFQTTKSTLTKFDGMLKVMIETEIPVTKDESDAIFIDRDPKHFNLILDYLRDNQVSISDERKKVEEIKKEAEFYQLGNLSYLCDQKLELLYEMIDVNVGGTIFTTKKKTLRRYSSFFKQVLENHRNSATAFDFIFIDRDPKHFNVILEFMRNDHVELPDCLREVWDIEAEAHYYGMTQLENICKKKDKELVKAARNKRD